MSYTLSPNSVKGQGGHVFSTCTSQRVNSRIVKTGDIIHTRTTTQRIAHVFIVIIITHLIKIHYILSPEDSAMVVALIIFQGKGLLFR